MMQSSFAVDPGSSRYLVFPVSREISSENRSNGILPEPKRTIVELSAKVAEVVAPQKFLRIRPLVANSPKGRNRRRCEITRRVPSHGAELVRDNFKLILTFI